MTCVSASLRRSRSIFFVSDFLSLLVKRPGSAAEDGAIDVCHRHIDTLTRAGGVDAMFVIVGRCVATFTEE